MSRPWDFLQEFKDNGFFQGEWPTLPEVLNITTSRFPDRKAFTSYSPVDFTLTYKELQSKILEVANYIATLNLGKGTKIAVTGKNSPEWAIAFLATLYSGCIIIPIDSQLKVSEIQGLMETAEVKVLFCDNDKIDQLQGTHFLANSYSLEGQSDFTYIMDLKTEEKVNLDSPVETDIAAILFTSGTTGRSKGVMLTHKNFVSDCYLAQDNLNIMHTDVFYALLPLHHSYTMTSVFIESLSVGSEIIFGKKMVAAQIFKDFKKGHVTMFLGIPLLFNKILKGLLKGIREKGIIVYGLIRFLMSISGLIKKVFKVNPGKKMFGSILDKVSLRDIRICISGGGPLPPSTFKLYNQLGIDFVQGYGLTETAPMLALNPTDHFKVESVGKILPQIDMKLINLDEEGRGEIVVKGPMVMRGYYNNEEQTKEIFTEDGYLKTGDIGHLDSENYLYLTGRMKNLIVTEGGKNVFPEEIEDKFQLFDEVDQVLIKGYVKDAKMKVEGIEALIYPSQDFFTDKTTEEIQKSIEGIISHVNQELLPYQRIEKTEILKEPLEMTTTKKIKRHLVN